MKLFITAIFACLLALPAFAQNADTAEEQPWDFIPIGFGSGTYVAGVEGSIFASMSDEVYGVQAAPLFNSAKKIEGLQASTLVNYADSAKGLQFGLVNIAKDKSFQIGLLNFIKDSSVPFFPFVNFRF